MLHVLGNSYRVACQHWRAVVIVWGCQAVVATTLGWQTYLLLQSALGRSLALQGLNDGFDFTVVFDFVNTHGDTIATLLRQLPVWILFWIVFSVFLNAGLLVSAVGGGRSWQSFWSHSAAFFPVFLKIAGFFWALAIGWSAVVWLPVVLFLEPLLRRSASEISVVWGSLGMLLLWLCGLAMLFLWSVSSRLYKLKHAESSVRQCLRAGLELCLRHRWKLLGWIAAMSAAGLLCWVVFEQLKKGWSAAFPAIAFPILMLQQAFSGLKIGLRLMMYAGVNKIISRE